MDEQERPGLRAQKKRRTQDAILRAAFGLFAQKGYDAVSVEEIAAAAEVAPRTFYRYFPTKEDAVFFAPDAQAALKRAFAQAPEGENDVERVVRAMTAAMTSRSPEHEARMYKLIEATPALQARIFQMMWDTQDALVDGLLGPGPRTEEAQFRALIITQTVTHAVRVVYLRWIRSGQQGSLSAECKRAIAVLRDAFGPLPRKARRAP